MEKLRKCIEIVESRMFTLPTDLQPQIRVLLNFVNAILITDVVPQKQKCPIEHQDKRECEVCKEAKIYNSAIDDCLAHLASREAKWRERTSKERLKDIIDTAMWKDGKVSISHTDISTSLDLEITVNEFQEILATAISTAMEG